MTILENCQTTPARSAGSTHVSAEMAGLFPMDHRGNFTSNRTHEWIRATMMDRDYSRAHLCKLRLPFLAVFRRFLDLPDVIPTELLLIPSEFWAKNGRKPPFLPGSDGIIFFRFPPVKPLQC